MAELMLVVSQCQRSKAVAAGTCWMQPWLANACVSGSNAWHGRYGVPNVILDHL